MKIQILLHVTDHSVLTYTFHAPEIFNYTCGEWLALIASYCWIKWIEKKYVVLVWNWPWIPNFSLFLSLTSRFQVAGHFETSAPNHPKRPWTLHKVKKNIYTPYMLLQFPSLGFPCISLLTRPFRITGYFETSALNDVKLALNITRSKVPHIIQFIADSQHVTACVLPY